MARFQLCYRHKCTHLSFTGCRRRRAFIDGHFSAYVHTNTETTTLDLFGIGFVLWCGPIYVWCCVRALLSEPYFDRFIDPPPSTTRAYRGGR